MANLRKRANNILKLSVENTAVFGLPVELTDPDGNVYTTTNDGRELAGQALFHRTTVNPDTGVGMIVVKPVLTLRRSSLTRIPVEGEVWFVKMPDEPDPGATKKDYILDQSQAIEGGASVGIIRLYLKETVQSP